MGQETVRKKASLTFMSSLKLRVLPAPSVQEACLHPSMFVQKTWACAEDPPNLSLCSPDPNQSQYCSFKSLGAKEFENETHRTMETAKGQGSRPVQLCPGRDGHPTWHAGGVGNQISLSSPDPHWSEPPLCEIGQKPGEIIAFLLTSSGPVWDPYAGGTCGHSQDAPPMA